MSNDSINRPAHYTSGSIEVIDFIEDKHLGFHLGNVVKYVARAGKKNPATRLEDLRKAEWYLQREIMRELKTAAEHVRNQYAEAYDETREGAN